MDDIFFYLCGKRQCRLAEGAANFFYRLGLKRSGGSKPKLSAPTVSLSGDTLTITATDENTKVFAILVDGVEKAAVGVS